MGVLLSCEIGTFLENVLEDWSAGVRAVAERMAAPLYSDLRPFRFSRHQDLDHCAQVVARELIRNGYIAEVERMAEELRMVESKDAFRWVLDKYVTIEWR